MAFTEIDKSPIPYNRNSDGMSSRLRTARRCSYFAEQIKKSMIDEDIPMNELETRQSRAPRDL